MTFKTLSACGLSVGLICVNSSLVQELLSLLNSMVIADVDLYPATFLLNVISVLWTW